MKKIHTIFLIPIFIFSLLFCACSNNTEKDSNTLIKSGRELIKQNKPETAVIQYKNAIKADPENDVAYFELAETYVVLGQLKQAIKFYELAARVNPESLPPLLRLAQVYLQTDQLLASRNYINKVLEISPSSIKAYHLLSSIQINERDLDSAIETLNKAASIDDKNIKTYLSLAQLYIKINAIEKAKQSYKKAMICDSSSRLAYIGLVKLYAFEKNWVKVEALLNEILETHGSKAQKHSDLARFYEGRKQYALTEEHFQKAVLEDEKSTTPLINLAEFYMRRNKKEKAIVTMTNALGKQKDLVLVYTGLSEIYSHFNMDIKAEESINKALSIKPKDVDALFQKGRVLIAKNDFKQALSKFDEVISIDKINAKAYYYRALCIKERGATDLPGQQIFRAAAGMLDNPEQYEQQQVKENLLAAILVDPGYVSARLELTQIYILEKDLIKAKKQLEEVFKFSAPNLKTMTLLSAIHILEGKIKEAEEILNVIIEKNPNYIPAYIRLGLLYNSTGKTAQAIQIFKKIIQLDSDQLGVVKMVVNTYIMDKQYENALEFIEGLLLNKHIKSTAFFENLKGEIYLKTKKTDAAMSQFKKAIDRKPDYIAPRMHLANLLNSEKKSARALEQYKHIETLNPEYVPALMAIGTIYNSKNDLEKAEKYYRKILKIDPNHPYANNNLAFILSEKPGRIDHAFRFAKTARQNAPKDPNVLDTLGWIYYQKGNYLNALSELKESLDLNSSNPLTCYHYGMTLYKTKEYEKAREYFNKALKLDPKFKDAGNARQMLN